MSEKTLSRGELMIAIDTICLRKRTANVVPSHALRVADIFKELKQYPQSEIDRVLRELLNMKRIVTHRTANDVGIEIV